MNKLDLIKKIREKMLKGKPTIGSWMQLSCSDVAEIMGSNRFDWVAIDLEHGGFSREKLPDLFRALELGNTLPFARIAKAEAGECKTALDAGAAGLILPMIENAKQLEEAVRYSKWPPTGSRGVAFCRANKYGIEFDNYRAIANQVIIIAMIESKEGVENIESILSVEGLDAVLIGPYDLSASLGVTGMFKSKIYHDYLNKLTEILKSKNMPYGLHIVEDSPRELENAIEDGQLFIPYSMDSVLIRSSFSKLNSIFENQEKDLNH